MAGGGNYSPAAQKAKAAAAARAAATKAAMQKQAAMAAIRADDRRAAAKAVVAPPPLVTKAPSYRAPAVQPTPPAPPPPPPPPVSPGNQSIKIATAEKFISGEEVVGEDTMFTRTVSDIASMELLEITRTSAVDGIDQTYLPITGLADLNMQNDPTKIIALQNASDEYFRQFSIPLERYTPSEGTGEDGEIVYIDRDPASSTYNSLIVNTVNIKSTERLEIEFIYFDSALNVKWYN